MEVSQALGPKLDCQTAREKSQLRNGETDFDAIRFPRLAQGELGRRVLTLEVNLMTSMKNDENFQISEAETFSRLWSRGWVE